MSSSLDLSMLKIESEREDDGRWIAEVPALPGVLTYGATRPKPAPGLWPWRFASSRIASKTASRCRAKSPAFLQRHDVVVFGQSTACSGCFGSNRMDSQRQTGSHRVLQRPGSPNFVFAFHDGDEIGPRMLARIAKHTGLKPEDL
jgi:hypothetical protein